MAADVGVQLLVVVQKAVQIALVLPDWLHAGSTAGWALMSASQLTGGYRNDGVDCGLSMSPKSADGQTDWRGR